MEKNIAAESLAMRISKFIKKHFSNQFLGWFQQSAPMFEYLIMIQIKFSFHGSIASFIATHCS